MKFFIPGNERNRVLFDSIIIIGFVSVNIEPSVTNLGQDDNNFVSSVLVNSKLFNSYERFSL